MHSMLRDRSLSGSERCLCQRPGCVGTPAAGNLRAKTGTLNVSRSLAGYVRGKSGQMIAVAIIVNSLGLPVLGFLRDTQNYVHLAARGLTLFDVPPGRVEKDLAQWEAICRWLDTP